MKIQQQQIELIINFGALGYHEEKMASILEVEEEILSEAFNDKNSQFRKLYDKGKNLADYAIDLKLFEMAKAGDIKALEKLNLRKL